jgi:hypothetical protein
LVASLEDLVEALEQQASVLAVALVVELLDVEKVI